METAQMKQESRRRLAALQARFDALETEARGRIHRALDASQHRLSEFDEMLARVSREDWSMEGMRKRFDTLRARAERFRATAVKRVNEMPANAVTALASGTRGPVQNLARELERLAKLVEPHVGAESTAREAEVVLPPPEPRPPRVKPKVEA